MRSKTYRANTMKEAMTRVRRDLGGDEPGGRLAVLAGEGTRQRVALPVEQRVRRGPQRRAVLDHPDPGDQRTQLGLRHARGGEPAEVSAQRGQERLALRPSGRDPGQVVASDAAEDKRLLGREVGEQRRLGHLRGLGDLVDRHGVEAALGEQPQRHRGDPLPRLLLLAFAQSCHAATISILSPKSNPV